jgi:hypothetical protein
MISNDNDNTYRFFNMHSDHFLDNSIYGSTLGNYDQKLSYVFGTEKRNTKRMDGMGKEYRMTDARFGNYMLIILIVLNTAWHYGVL